MLYADVQLSSQWQCIMEKVNKEDQDSDFSLFKLSSPHVNGMFYMCKRLNTNFVVKFRAVELFNRWVFVNNVIHVKKIIYTEMPHVTKLFWLLHIA